MLRTNDSTVRGFTVINFPDEGIEINGTTGFGDGNVIYDNWVGITSAGAAAGNSDDGILITEDADNNEVYNNIVGESGGVMEFISAITQMTTGSGETRLVWEAMA